MKFNKNSKNLSMVIYYFSNIPKKLSLTHNKNTENKLVTSIRKGPWLHWLKMIDKNLEG
jgi:hypothetical protein